MGERVEAGLRSLGLLYGSASELSEILAREPDEAAAVRAYLVRGRPHLLSCYDLDEMVGMVLAAGEGAGGSSAMEQFGPR